MNDDNSDILLPNVVSKAAPCKNLVGRRLFDKQIESLRQLSYKYLAIDIMAYFRHCSSRLFQFSTFTVKILRIFAKYSISKTDT